MGKVIFMASGKGGTGKTSLTAGISTCLAKVGFKVLCVDADMGLGNLDIALGLSDRSALNFGDVIKGDYPAASAVIRHDRIGGLNLLSAPLTESGVSESGFASLIAELRGDFDFCFLDCGAGLGQSLRLCCAAADMGIIVSTPDISSLRDSARTARLCETLGVNDLKLVVNRVRPWLIAADSAPNIDDAMDETGLALLGIVPEDEKVIASSNRSEILILNTSDGAAKAYLNISRRLAGERVPIMRLKNR